MLRSSSSAALVAKPPKVMPTRAEDYELQDEIGQGVSAKVRARSRLPCCVVPCQGSCFSR
jgi:hypothetical protein